MPDTSCSTSWSVCTLPGVLSYEYFFTLTCEARSERKLAEIRRGNSDNRILDECIFEYVYLLFIN